MSFLNAIFGSSAASPAPAPAAGNPPANAQPNGGTPGSAANGVVPPGTNATANDPTPAPNASDASPLAQFGDVWNTPANAAPAEIPVFSGMDPTKVMESARKVNFAGAINQQQMEAIQKGGPEAMQAFAQAMNSVAQTVYGQSAITTAKMVEQALSQAQQQYDSKIPTMLKKLSANEGLAASNPMLQNPAVQPLVGALTEQLTRKNPNATAAEIQQQVNDYFAALGTSFAPKAQDSAPANTRPSTDWSAFLE